METYWNDFVKEDNILWRNEYNKHGYCYTKKLLIEDYEAYFRTTIKLFVDLKLDTLISDLIYYSKEDKISITGDDLRNFINKKYPNLKFLLYCVKISEVSFLLEIRFYLSLDLELFTTHKKSNCPNSEPIIIPIYLHPASIWNTILILIIFIIILLSVVYLYYRSRKKRNTSNALIEGEIYTSYM